MAHPAGVHLDTLERSPGIRIELAGVVFLENLNEAGNRADRRAQIVRHRIAERFELAVGRAQLRGAVFDAMLELGARLFDFLGHRVERVSQPPQLVLPIEVDVDRRPRFRHRLGRLGDPAKRRGQLAAQHPANNRGDRQEDEGDHGRPPDETIGRFAHRVSREFDDDLPRRWQDQSRSRERRRHAGPLVFEQPRRGRNVDRRRGHRLREVGPRAVVRIADQDRRLPADQPGQQRHRLLCLRGVAQPAALDDVAERGAGVSHAAADRIHHCLGFGSQLSDHWHVDRLQFGLEHVERKPSGLGERGAGGE